MSPIISCYFYVLIILTPSFGSLFSLCRFETNTIPLKGGVLIAKRFVLTAAHCVDYYYTTGFDIGAHTKSNGKPVELYAAIVHPLYDGLSNDIALVYLAEDVVNTTYARISPDMVNTPGTSMTVIGFGNTNQYDYYSASNHLQRTNIEYIDSGVCRLAYPKKKIETGMMCASSKDGKDSCYGDSGGPLLLTPDDNPANDLVAGIVSWGYGCGDSRYPGVYTRISRYYDWIVETMCTINSDSAPEYCTAPDGRLEDKCGVTGDACHTSDECCSGRCDLFSNTCFVDVKKGGQRRGRGSNGMGGAAGGSTNPKTSREINNSDAVREIARDFP